MFVTAFPNLSLMARYLGEITWETEVWVVDASSHLIHSNGERFSDLILGTRMMRLYFLKVCVHIYKKCKKHDCKQL